jgi:hypothetical protein
MAASHGARSSLRDTLSQASLPTGWQGQQSLSSIFQRQAMQPGAHMMQPGDMSMHQGMAPPMVQPGMMAQPGTNMMAPSFTHPSMVQPVMVQQAYMNPGHPMTTAAMGGNHFEVARQQVVQGPGVAYWQGGSQVVSPQQFSQMNLMATLQPQMHPQMQSSASLQSSGQFQPQQSHQLQLPPPPMQAPSLRSHRGAATPLSECNGGNPQNWNEYEDHYHGISSAYKVVGCAHMYKSTQVLPIVERGIALCLIAPSRFTSMSVSEFSEMYTDIHVFIHTGLSGHARLCQLMPKSGKKCKGLLRLKLVNEARRKLAEQPNRLHGLAPDHSNLLMFALKLGYQVADLPEPYRSQAVSWASNVKGQVTMLNDRS